MKSAIQRAVAVAVTVFLFALARPANAGQSPGNDLDNFMAKVLARRKVSEDAVRDYVLNETEQVVQLIRQVTVGKTLLMVEHDMSVVFDLADRIAVLVYGQIIAHDAPERIRANAAVQEAYLGVPQSAP